MGRGAARPVESGASRRLNLSVQYAVHGGSVPSRPDVRKWARAACQGGGSVTVRFVGEEEGRELNCAYREKDYPTNVLSFAYSAVPLCGDLVVCVPVVEREALQQGKTVSAHFAHLIVHGMLHLQGYDHVTDTDASVMEACERDILSELGYPDPYGSERD